MQKAAMNSSIDGNVRRRDRPPPTTYYGTHPSSSEEDILLGGGSYGIEEGLYMQRQRRQSISPWYKQPQKMILVATLCFVGSVLYLANLAHTIIQTNNQLHNMKNTNNKMKSARNLYGASSSSGSTSSLNNGKASDEHIKEWLETHDTYGNKYGATASNSGEANNNEDFQQWMNNRYGASSSVYSSDYKKSGISSSSSSSSTNSELGDAYNDYLEYLQSEEKMGNVQDQSNLGASVGGGADAVYKEWLEYNNNGGQHTKYNPNNGQYTQTATPPRTMSEALTKIQQLESELKARKAQLRQGSGQ